MSVMPRLTLASVMVAVLAGCAHQPPAKTTTVTTTRTTVPATDRSSTSTSTVKRTPHRSPASAAAPISSSANLPEHTGIAACDDYLSSYLACHRAAKIFAPAQLQSRYDAMRTSLLRDSQDPDIRPQLATRCNSLASQLRDALHGKSCEANAAPASTTP